MRYECVVAIAFVLGAGCGRFAFEPSTDSNNADVVVTPDGPSGAWSYVRQNGDSTLNTASAPSPHNIQILVSAGDLVVVATDGETPTVGPITFDTNAPGIITLAPSIQKDFATVDQNAVAKSLTNGVTWGVVAATAAPTTITITATNMTGWSDLSASVFHGGIAAPQLVAVQHTMGGPGGLVSCGPVATVPGGAAFYIAVRWTCADAPLAGPFQQVGTLVGNPYGATAPNDGTAVSATLSDCGNGGGWLCSTVSLSP